MLPEGKLSSIPVPAAILGGRARNISPALDYEDGPIAISDTSEGLFYQTWTGWIGEGGVYLEAPSVEAFLAYSASGVHEMSFTFDQNGRYAIALMQNNQCRIYWWDPVEGGYYNTYIGPGIVSPKIILDDKRSNQHPVSDMVMGYIRQNNLCYRLQRDRFTVEYVLAAELAPVNTPVRLNKIGKNRGLRLQFIVGN